MYLPKEIELQVRRTVTELYGDGWNYYWMLMLLRRYKVSMLQSYTCKLSWSFQVSFQVMIFMQHMCCITPKRWLINRATLLKWPDLRNLEVLWNMYPPVNKHSNGKSPFWIGNTSSNGGCSISMCNIMCLHFTQYHLSLWRKAGGLPMRVKFIAIPTPKYSSIAIPGK